MRALIDSERLAARRVGGRWLIDEAGLGGDVVTSRPMSPRMAWAFNVALSRVAEQGAARGSGTGGSELLGRLDLASAERRRVDQRVMRLLAADDPALLLRSWLAKRAARRGYSAAPGDVAALVTDDRVVRSGMSDSAVGISISDEVEGYVALANERDIVDAPVETAANPHRLHQTNRVRRSNSPLRNHRRASHGTASIGPWFEFRQVDLTERVSCRD